MTDPLDELILHPAVPHLQLEPVDQIEQLAAGEKRQDLSLARHDVPLGASGLYIPPSDQVNETGSVERGVACSARKQPGGVR